MKTILRLLFITLLIACQQQNQSENQPEESTSLPDPHSFSRPDLTAVNHLDLVLTVDFEKEQLSGSATWTLDSAHGKELILDVYDLDLKEVEVDGKKVKFEMSEKDEILGQALIIPLKKKSRKVKITYATNPGARALQWLEPGQTAGKKLPFLFTQSQAILARTWLPCQDSPGVRYSYNATVTVPPEMMAVMSAKNPQAKNDDGVYNFEMEIPIPSYLMALAVGDLAFEPVSNRTGVYAEPDLLDAAAWEFGEMETMVVSAEALYGPYIWGRYDVLVLPPAFPFGGMENPRLTFATPTIITGDRSLTSLIAHELAHSWSGNLVTNATWNDFWLNEGFTTYFEMRIMEAVYGRDYSEMIAMISHQDMVTDIGELMDEEPASTSLKMNMDNEDPDDGVGAVAYDKGYHFVRLCEETVGRERWDAFLKNYFAANKFKSMTTEDFVERLKNELLSEDEIAQIGVDTWVYGEGIPDNCPVPQSDRFTRVDSIRAAMQVAVENGNGLPAGTITTTESWSTYEWVNFLRGLERPSLEFLYALDNAFSFTATHNAEIKAAWLQPTIRATYGEAVERDPQSGIKTNYNMGDPLFFIEQVEYFLVNVGRRKFLTPTYRAMVETGQRDWALQIYENARPNYHAVSRETMDKLLKFNQN
jgi:leukotriene-A4 hydrolase